MTEYWKSNAMHWCELCRVWMNDTKAAKLNHERGAKHQENLAKKLRDMSRRADAEKSEKARAAATMDSIEQAARKQYEADQQAAQEQAGKWVWNEGSGYYYNAKHNWYYDHKAQWYYGGNPPAWTQTPSIPSAANFGAAPHEGGNVPQKAAAAGAGPGPGSRAAAGPPSNSSQAAETAASGPNVKVIKKVVQLPSHPLATTGGHQMPVSGRIGGAKGVGSSAERAVDHQKVSGWY
eukprot:GHRR01015047.1.p1 GENE.GHRR01015047.1~~GHRR01015047.1.p1  ORF type:complete len:235 (+),score=81.12 GHRR01015047.1:149-853(+)